MAHEITIRQSGFAEMAYVGEKPWHGLGQLLPANTSIEEWQVAAGLDWQIKSSPVQFMNGEMHQFDGNRVLYRSDNNSPLAIVSDRYKEVQPKEILEFYRDLVEVNDFSIETAGTLHGGKMIWALAKTGFYGDVVANDPVKAYLLLVTSCDGKLATTAQFTSVRVVCQNTLHMSLGKATRDESDAAKRVKVRHSTVFEPDMVKAQLGLDARTFHSFMDRMKALSEVSLTKEKSRDIIYALFADKTTNPDVENSRGYKLVRDLFNGMGRGSKLPGVDGTAWGLLNAVTEYSDHYAKAASRDHRLNSAWFGAGASLKDEALNLLETI